MRCGIVEAAFDFLSSSIGPGSARQCNKTMSNFRWHEKESGNIAKAQHRFLLIVLPYSFRIKCIARTCQSRKNYNRKGVAQKAVAKETNRKRSTRNKKTIETPTPKKSRGVHHLCIVPFGNTCGPFSSKSLVESLPFTSRSCHFVG
jgi:hypothetical protein